MKRQKAKHGMEIHLGYTSGNAWQISKRLVMGTQDVRNIIRRTESELKRSDFGRNRVISV